MALILRWIPLHRLIQCLLRLNLVKTLEQMALSEKKKHSQDNKDTPVQDAKKPQATLKKDDTDEKFSPGEPDDYDAEEFSTD